MTETLAEFHDRIFVNYATYPKEPHVLVWATAKHKKDLNSESKPEKWSLKTALNYIDWLGDKNG